MLDQGLLQHVQSHDAHRHCQQCDRWPDWWRDLAIRQELGRQQLAGQIERVFALLERVNKKENYIMADLTAVTAAVENATTVDESAVVLLGQLSDLIRANASDPAALAALADQLTNESSSLAAAVAANTPAA